MEQPNHIKIQINNSIDLADYYTITPFNSPSSTSSITNNTSDETENTCSICLEDININDSIMACSCKNPVHINCLLTWIEYKNTINCEICNTQYSIPNEIIENFYQNINQQNNYDNQNYQDNEDNEDNHYNAIEEDIRLREQRILELRRQMYENRMNRLYSGILYSIVLLFILLIIIYFN